jgi:dipeptidyl aminopeptidase/acylaminoacyl peptidase
LSAALALLFVAATGFWQGTLEREGAPLEVEVAIAERGGALEGRFSSAQLRAVNVPLSKVAFDSPHLSWQLVGDRTTMAVDATISNEAMTGTFKDGAAMGVVKLRRAAESRFPARSEEVTFEGAGGTKLAGSILWPPGKGPFPGVVFLHGSGGEGRWASLYLAHEFARAGIAALVFDKRGVGASDGDWRTAGFEELVKDDVAAVRALRARPGIDPGRVGIHGHSQGGTIAPWVAVADPGIAFVIASAASGVSMAEAEIYSVGNSMGVPGMSPGDRALAERFVRALVATAYHGAPREELEAARRAAQGKPWMIAVPPDSSPYWSFSARIAGYDPLRYWREVRVPVLLAYGARDERVPVQPSISRITTVLRTETMYALKVFADADHGFRVRPKAGRSAWPETAVGYPSSLIDWVLRLIIRP